MTKTQQPSLARRKVLKFLGLGTLAGIVSSEKVFARQFTGPVAPVEPPQMVYDPNLQLMVDPTTREPVMKSQKVATIRATVTAGCKDCPKCDDNCG